MGVCTCFHLRSSKNMISVKIQQQTLNFWLGTIYYRLCQNPRTLFLFFIRERTVSQNGLYFIITVPTATYVFDRADSFMNALVYVVIDQGIHKGKMKVAWNEKWKKLHGFFFMNIANFEAFLWNSRAQII